MGEAKEIVSGAGAEHSRRQNKAAGDLNRGLLGHLEAVLDDLDRAIEAKQQDVALEGMAKLAENHYKLGLLMASAHLIRRAYALMEDYGAPLEVKEKRFIETVCDTVKGLAKRHSKAKAKG